MYGPWAGILSIIWESVRNVSSQGIAQESVFYFTLNIYLFIIYWVLGLCCFARAISSGDEPGYSLLWCMGFSLWWLLLLWGSGFGGGGSVQ